MNTKHFSEEVQTKLIDFFTNNISPKDMAKTIRQVNYILSLHAMRDCETLQSKNTTEYHFYCMNRLAEALDPYLDTE